MGKVGKIVAKASASATTNNESKGKAISATKSATNIVAKAMAKAKAKSNTIGIMVVLECHEGMSHKFYRLVMVGTTVTSTYGRCGTDGQIQTKEFPTEAKGTYGSL